ncbi:MAG: 30S ribosomal protein S8 [Candidatus Anammoxibacter sp.]
MSMNDPIADLLTRIRNANLIGRKEVEAPCSKIKIGILAVMKKEGYIKDYKELEADQKKTLRIYLKYGPMKKKVLNFIKRESKGGKRVYKRAEDIGKVLDGMGISILSTSKGILSNSECKKVNVGGELLCTIW